MRILFITNMYPPHHYGGYELSCADTVRRFRQMGHQVSVLTSTITVTGVTNANNDSGYPVWRELELYWQDHLLLNPSLRERYAIERGNQAALARALDQGLPDLVSVWNMGAMSLGLLTTIQRRAIPIAFVLADTWPCYSVELDAWSRLFRGRLSRFAAGPIRVMARVPTATNDFSLLGPCLFFSDHIRRTIQDQCGWSLKRTGIVYSGVETDVFPIAEEGSPIASDDWGGQLLYVGRIDERKGIDTALKALPHLPSARLRVVGRGDNQYLAELHRLTRELGVEDRTTFSVVERDRLGAEYRAADVLIFPSVYEEPFGIVPLEGMACDTPVVATGRGGSGEYLQDGVNSLLFEASDELALAAAVQRLAGDAHLRAKLVTGGRRTARFLTTEAWIECLMEWHQAASSGFVHGQPPDRHIPIMDA